VDLYKAIAELRREKERLDQCIAYLETLAESGPETRPRGRKKAAAEAKRGLDLEVSEGMVRYWRSRESGGAGEGS
jgi:hypothetical protein